jgi:hypothetical protein
VIPTDGVPVKGRAIVSARVVNRYLNPLIHFLLPNAKNVPAPVPKAKAIADTKSLFRTNVIVIAYPRKSIATAKPDALTRWRLDKYR